VAHVRLDGRERDHQLGRDLRVGESAPDQPQHPELGPLALALEVHGQLGQPVGVLAEPPHHAPRDRRQHHRRQRAEVLADDIAADRRRRHAQPQAERRDRHHRARRPDVDVALLSRLAR